MNTGLAKTNGQAGLAKAPGATIDGLERVLIEGDLGGLSAQQRVDYYARVCASTGLNPLTQPFEYLKLQGKTILYARRACTDQLRKIHHVSVTIVSRERLEGVYVVTARATTPDGRCDESVGAVPLENLKGEALANALMKAETKAKRRVTLAICGLSMLDESEVAGAQAVERPTRSARPTKTLDDVAAHAEAVAAPSAWERGEEPAHDPETGEVIDAEFDGTVPAPEPMPPACSCPLFSGGKHQGQSVMDVPAGYLRWMKEQKGYAEKTSAEMKAWVEYAIAHHEWTKLQESANG